MRTTVAVVAVVAVVVLSSVLAAQAPVSCTWTDHPIVAGQTPLKAVHLNELRACLAAILDNWPEKTIPPAPPVEGMHVTISDLGTRRVGIDNYTSGTEVFGTIRNTGASDIGAEWGIRALFYSESGGLLDRATLNTGAEVALLAGGSVAFTMHPIVARRTGPQPQRFMLEVVDAAGRTILCAQCEWRN